MSSIDKLIFIAKEIWNKEITEDMAAKIIEEDGDINLKYNKQRKLFKK
jgi:hypothetical protein